MPRSSRVKPDSQSRFLDLSHKCLPLSPRESTELEDQREAQLWSPASSTIRKAPKKDLAGYTEHRPSTPEEWIGHALATLRQGDIAKSAEAVLDLTYLEPDLLEFLVTADEEIRDTVYETVCGSTFPKVREEWEGSTSYIILERLRAYLNRLPPGLADRKVDEASRQATLLLTALGALDHVSFGLGEKNEPEEEEENSFFRVKTKMSQKKRKALAGNENPARQPVVIDPSAFTAIDLELPTCIEDALDIEHTLLSRLREVLEVLFAAFGNTELAVHAKALFFKQPLQFVPAKSTPTATAEIATKTGPTCTPDPGVFPHIRPLAAANLFDESTGLGAWNVIVSGRAVADLRQMQKRDSRACARVLKKITELAQGFFSDGNQKRLAGLDTKVLIYEAKVSRDRKIVYQIDLDTDVGAKIDKQIIKLYGVYTHAQLDRRMWSLVSYYVSHRRGEEYRRRCSFRNTHCVLGQNMTLPAQFKHEDDMETVGVSRTEFLSREGVTDQDLLHLHSLMTLEKFLPMSQSLIDSIVNDSGPSHIFHVSAKEKEIIYHDSACFVLGRSGTGKTTSIVFKMIGIEKRFKIMGEAIRPRQVFVTQSRVLAQRIQGYFHDLVKSLSTTQERNFGSVEEEVLADLDDEDARVFGLPSKYSMLEDHHFPLFLTFDQLCTLLEGDFGHQFSHSALTKLHMNVEGSANVEVTDETIDSDHELEDASSQVDVREPLLALPSSAYSEHEPIQEAKRALVTFDTFVAAYWPHFDERLTKGLDPALVYGEFLGVIEGSEFTLGSKSCALCREAYASLSHRKSLFDSQRDRIYDLYEMYRKHKHQLGAYDAADRTHALITATNRWVPGHKLDCLYIDEAQDHLLVDIKLLHNLSNNPHGLFVAGDTAQTISAGSSFRFEDLKAFMWRLEEQDEAVCHGKRSAVHPTLFHLAANRRSHSGIVDCANSLVQLISELFPYSIDKFQKESGIVDGPKPVFFSGWVHDVQFQQFLRGEGDTGIELGASQVVIVRDEAARSALRAQVGEIGLILTLHESKGLEFNDVLLYNFFKDSVPNASTWRVILHGLHGTNVELVPRFDEVRHSVICTELKSLYVCLTRARKHCWIWDMSEKADPMKAFWGKQNLIVQCGPEDPMPQLGAPSSPSDWAQSGQLLFDKRLYSQARLCFEKAGLLLERDVSDAYDARKQARLMQVANTVDQVTWRAAFNKTATHFLECAIPSKDKQRISCYLRAAECFLRAENWTSAAEAFLSATEFDMAAKYFHRAGCIAEAVGVVRNHRGQLREDIVEEIIAVARLQYLQTAQYKQLNELFDDIEEQLAYVEKHGVDLARIHVFEFQAAEEAFDRRNIIEGVHLLLRSDDAESFRRGVEQAFHGLWIMLPFGPYANKLENPEIGSLIQHLRSNTLPFLNEDETHQLEAFEALYAKELDRAMTLAESHGKLLGQNPQAHSSIRSMLALLCFSYSSHLLIPARNSTISEFIVKAGLAINFLSLLLGFGQKLDLTCPNTQKLLGFEPVGSGICKGSASHKSSSPEFRVYSTSLMFEGAQKALGKAAPTFSVLGLSSLDLSEPDTRRLAINAIHSVLRSGVRDMHNAANISKYLHPCLDFAIFGKCKRSDCGRQEVNSLRLPDEQRQTIFNMRARALIIQIRIIHMYQAQTQLDEVEQRKFRSIWARKIYELLMPQFPPLGNAVCIDRALIPELDACSGVISSWCGDALGYLNPGRGDPARFLSDVLLYLDLAFRVQYDSFAAYAPMLHFQNLVSWRKDLILDLLGPRSARRHIVHDFIDFYLRKSIDIIPRVIRAVHHVVTNHLPIEANVLVHFLEFIGREIIVQCRWWSLGPEGVFDGLLVPRSWALDLAKRALPPPQMGFAIDAYMDSLYKMLELLRAHQGNTSSLYNFAGPLSLLTRSVLIIRICRLLILIACNIGFDLAAKNKVRDAISRSLSGPGDMYMNLCARFAGAGSWRGLEDALTQSPLNRGADELVYLARCTDSSQPQSIKGIKSVNYASIQLDLERVLSLSLSRSIDTKRSGTMLDPKAKPFVPLAQPRALANKHEDLAEASEAPNQSEADGSANQAPSQLGDILPTHKLPFDRFLTIKEVHMGRKILFCYRRYILRQQVRARWAARTMGVLLPLPTS